MFGHIKKYFDNLEKFMEYEKERNEKYFKSNWKEVHLGEALTWMFKHKRNACIVKNFELGRFIGFTIWENLYNEFKINESMAKHLYYIPFCDKFNIHQVKETQFWQDLEKVKHLGQKASLIPEIPVTEQNIHEINSLGRAINSFITAL